MAVPLRKRLTGFFLSILFLTSVLLTYGPGWNARLPSWDKVYSWFRLTDPLSDVYDQPFTVTFLDVGQGDSALILTDSDSILIDTGNPGNEDTILNLLSRLQVDSLDCIITSHPHEDHIGSLSGVLDEVPVKQILQPDIRVEDLDDPGQYRAYLAKAFALNIPVRTVRPPEVLSFGSIQLELLGPLSVSENINNDSIAARITYGACTVLFTGDMEAEEESELLAAGTDLSADILKVGHHGSESSTTLPFLLAVHPAYAVISVGAGNDYGHPHADVLERLSEQGVTVFRTDEQGSLVFGSNGNEWFLPE